MGNVYYQKGGIYKKKSVILFVYILCKTITKNNSFNSSHTFLNISKY